ncbi:MAG TPA: hypothetical protein VN611_05290, partial [Patescibacteria group bacterium]|nr:hypothetical protein [Patescibacteria group bacterium]
MNSRRFRIQDTEPGMVLAAPVIGSGGRVILMQNTVLTEKLIDRLQNWNVFVVDVCEAVDESLSYDEDQDSPFFPLPAVTEKQQQFMNSYLDTVNEL